MKALQISWIECSKWRGAEVGWVNAIWHLDWWRGVGQALVERAVRAFPATR